MTFSETTYCNKYKSKKQYNQDKTLIIELALKLTSYLKKYIENFINQKLLFLKNHSQIQDLLIKNIEEILDNIDINAKLQINTKTKLSLVNFALQHSDSQSIAIEFLKNHEYQHILEWEKLENDNPIKSAIQKFIEIVNVLNSSDLLLQIFNLINSKVMKDINGDLAFCLYPIITFTQTRQVLYQLIPKYIITVKSTNWLEFKKQFFYGMSDFSNLLFINLSHLNFDDQLDIIKVLLILIHEIGHHMIKQYSSNGMIENTSPQLKIKNRNIQEIGLAIEQLTLVNNL